MQKGTLDPRPSEPILNSRLLSVIFSDAPSSGGKREEVQNMKLSDPGSRVSSLCGSKVEATASSEPDTCKIQEYMQ